jgi:hypothetical protein
MPTCDKNNKDNDKKVPDCARDARAYVAAAALFRQLKQDDVLRDKYKLTPAQVDAAQKEAKRLDAEGVLMAPLGANGLAGFCVFKAASSKDSNNSVEYQK